MRGIHWRGMLMLALAAGSLASCSALSSGRNGELQDELNRQRRLWRAQNIDNYSYTVQRMCFCPRELVAPVRVQVRDGRVESRAFAEGGAAVDPQHAQFWPAVEGLFEVVQDAIDEDADSIAVEYHPQLGYPTSIQVDYQRNVADEELVMKAGDLLPIR